MKIQEKCEPVNNVKLHVHAEIWKSVPANAVKEQEYHGIREGDSMNASILQSFQGTHL